MNFLQSLVEVPQMLLHQSLHQPCLAREIVKQAAFRYTCAVGNSVERKIAGTGFPRYIGCRREDFVA
jgi:hypothetical protein